jgi:hypothetical protein
VDLVSEADLAGKQGDMASAYANSSLKAQNDAQLDAYISQRDEVSPEVSEEGPGQQHAAHWRPGGELLYVVMFSW